MSRLSAPQSRLLRCSLLRVGRRSVLLLSFVGIRRGVFLFIVMDSRRRWDYRIGVGSWWKARWNIDCIRIVTIHTFLTIISIVYTTERYEYDELKLWTMSLAMSYVPILIEKWQLRSVGIFWIWVNNDRTDLSVETAVKQWKFESERWKGTLTSSASQCLGSL